MAASSPSPSVILGLFETSLLMQVGMSFLDALRGVAEASTDVETKSLITAVATGWEAGDPLNALTTHPALSADTILADRIFRLGLYTSMYSEAFRDLAVALTLKRVLTSGTAPREIDLELASYLLAMDGPSGDRGMRDAMQTWSSDTAWGALAPAPDARYPDTWLTSFRAEGVPEPVYIPPTIALFVTGVLHSGAQDAFFKSIIDWSRINVALERAR